MRTAVVLEWKDEGPFQCMVKINAKINIRSTLKQVFGRVSRVDPVLYRSKLGSTKNLQNYNEKELGQFELESV